MATLFPPMQPSRGVEDDAGVRGFWRISIFLLALIGFAVARAPARLFAPPPSDQLSYSSVDGTIWNAILRDAVIAGARAGDVSAALRPWPLVSGRAVVDVTAPGPDIRGDAQLDLGLFGDLRIASSTFSVNLSRYLGLGDLADRSTVTDARIAFSRGRCTSAEGVAETDVFVLAARELQAGEGLLLRGGLMCAGVDARLRVTGERDAETLAAQADVSSDGRGTWSIMIQTDKAAVAAIAATRGFTLDSEADVLKREGAFRWRR
ncbi:hypothetical protein GC169_00505 [bacterium]|nr:hypothetical protein [bacterium]